MEARVLKTSRKYSDDRRLLFTPPEQLDAVNHLEVKPFGVEGASLHRYRQDTALMQPTDPTPQRETLMAVLHLRNFGAHTQWRNGQELSVVPSNAGMLLFYDLRDHNVADVPFPFHTVHILIPNSAFGRSHRHLYGGSPRWTWQAGVPVEDQVLSHLIRSMLPYVESEGRPSLLFTEHVFEAAAVHVFNTYQAPRKSGESGLRLARWQESLAKELLIGHLTGDVSTSEVAAACGLPRDSFARMFRRTTGLPPYRWLNAQRIERAKALLAQTHDSLADIAFACGFANQSHFTAMFSRAIGISPGKFRRLTKM